MSSEAYSKILEEIKRLKEESNMTRVHVSTEIKR